MHPEDDRSEGRENEDRCCGQKIGAIRKQAADGGLRFRAYLPPSLADWLLELIENGTFADPSEAVFVMLGEMRELSEHPDLRRELLKRSLRAAADDPRPSVPFEEVEVRLRKWAEGPRPVPVDWDRG